MILSYNELKDLVAQGNVRNCINENINGSSIDVRLAKDILIEPAWVKNTVDPVNKNMPTLDEEDCEKGFKLLPNQFCLARTIEEFKLPDRISMEFKLKSSIARCGLNHALAGWADPTWFGTLTLELKNYLSHQSIVLREGMKIGQVIFYKHKAVPEEKSYKLKGRYNGQVLTTQSKGV